MNVDGDSLLRVQERVAPVLDIDVAVAVKYRRAALVVPGEGSLGEDKVQVSEDVQIVPQLLLVRRQLVAQICQHSLDLLLLLDLQGAQVVVQADDGHGLDKQGGPGGGLVVDHAGHLILVLRLHRQAVAAVTHGDDRLLEVGAAAV